MNIPNSKEQSELDQQDMEDVEEVEDDETGEDANNKGNVETRVSKQLHTCFLIHVLQGSYCLK